MKGAGNDRIGRWMRQWEARLPGLDTTGMAILGRARWISGRVRRDIEAVFARHGLDAGEFDVLATLRRADAPHTLTPTQLYRSLMISSGGLTARLAKLERAGLVTRRSNEEDGRSLQVTLTDPGQRRVDAVMREDMAVERALLSVLSADQRRQLASLLAVLVEGLDEETAPD